MNLIQCRTLSSGFSRSVFHYKSFNVKSLDFVTNPQICKNFRSFAVSFSAAEEILVCFADNLVEPTFH